MDPEATARLVLERGVAERVFSGAQAAWIDRSGVVRLAHAGATRSEGGSPVSAQTLFDIASLTKVFIASAALRLVARGIVALDSRLDTLLPAAEGTPFGRAMLEQLLAHEAGFKDWAPIYERIEPAHSGNRQAADRVLDAIFREAPVGEPGQTAMYSDLGFIVLGRALELATGAKLDRILAREVCGPLGLVEVGFGPVDRCAVDVEPTVAATENCPWRGRTLVGEVHDDNAWTMRGVAGHAGLFATATDVARLGEAWLRAVATGEWLPGDLACLAIKRRPHGRGLGWDLRSALGSSSGSHFGERAFGHLGFTGCSIWVDPDAGFSVALLTNRVHFGRDNNAIRKFRPAFHDALVEAADS